MVNTFGWWMGLPFLFCPPTPLPPPKKNPLGRYFVYPSTSLNDQMMSNSNHVFLSFLVCCCSNNSNFLSFFIVHTRTITTTGIGTQLLFIVICSLGCCESVLLLLLLLLWWWINTSGWLQPCLLATHPLAFRHVLLCYDCVRWC